MAAPPATLTLNDFQRIDPPDGPASPCDRQAVGISPVVVRSGANAGRLVVAYRKGLSLEFANPVEWCYNSAPTAGSPDGWSTAVPLTLDTSGADVFGYNGGSLSGSFEAQNFPSTALNANNPDFVYIAFAGSTTAVTGGDQNIDVYVARIQFVGTTSHTLEVKRITDAMLGDDEGTDQFFPAVTVDGYGGINLAYVRMENQGEIVVPYMRIMYTRMATWETLPSPDTTLALTSDFPVPHNPLIPGQQGIDEYISIASSGCLIYASYFQCEPEYNNSTTNVYVSRISVCPADTDDNGLVESDDVAAFGAAFAAQAPPADIDGNGVCNGTDVEQFFNAYTCGCGTP